MNLGSELLYEIAIYLWKELTCMQWRQLKVLSCPDAWGMPLRLAFQASFVHGADKTTSTTLHDGPKIERKQAFLIGNLIVTRICYAALVPKDWWECLQKLSECLSRRDEIGHQTCFRNLPREKLFPLLLQHWITENASRGRVRQNR